MTKKGSPQQLEHHPIADLFPMLPDDELKDLAEDIAARGLLQPIVLDGENRILDGRNRHAACALAGVEPAFTVYDGEDPDGYALSVNIARRHLTKGQQAMVIAKAGHLFKLNSNQSELARQTQVPQGRFSQAQTILRYAPDLADAVVTGAEKLDRAYKVAQERKRGAESTETHLSWLREHAPDLADLVVEEQLQLREAVAAAKEREQVEAERRQRHSRSFGSDLVSLWSLLDPDPVAFLERTWIPEANPHRTTESAQPVFLPDGLRTVARHLEQLADHLDEEGRTLL
jgi:ParB-like chromosome segregation protein Spo0J